LVTAAGVAWLLLLGIAFAFFRERGEPHPESALVLTIAKWSARAILVATALAVTYITNPGIKPPFLGGETVSEGQMNRGSLLSRPKSAPAKVRPTVKAKVVSSGNPERQLRPTQVTGPSTTKSTVKKPAPRNVASAPPKVSGPREGVDPFSSDASPN
jgi:hypothetical protein